MKKSLPNSVKEVRLSNQAKPGKKIFLSVIIPAYNEEENFKRGVLKDIRIYLVKQKFLAEVVLVNDGSTDKTAKLLTDFAKKNPRFRLVNIPHGGKLKAIEAGVKNAKGEVILFSDFDQSTPISEFTKFLPHLEKGVDIVIGDRVNRGSKRINDPFFRYFRSRVLNFIIQLMLFKGIDDTQCGFKALKATVARKFLPNLKVTHLTKPTGGFMGPWDIELLFLAKKAKLKIISVPVTWQFFPSKRLSIFSEPVRFIFAILKIRLFAFFNKYDGVY